MKKLVFVTLLIMFHIISMPPEFEHAIKTELPNFYRINNWINTHQLLLCISGGTIIALAQPILSKTSWIKKCAHWLHTSSSDILNALSLCLYGFGLRAFSSVDYLRSTFQLFSCALPISRLCATHPYIQATLKKLPLYGKKLACPCHKCAGICTTCKNSKMIIALLLFFIIAPCQIYLTNAIINFIWKVVIKNMGYSFATKECPICYTTKECMLFPCKPISHPLCIDCLFMLERNICPMCRGSLCM